MICMNELDDTTWMDGWMNEWRRSWSRGGEEGYMNVRINLKKKSGRTLYHHRVCHLLKSHIYLLCLLLLLLSFLPINRRCYDWMDGWMMDVICLFREHWNGYAKPACLKSKQASKEAPSQLFIQSITPCRRAITTGNHKSHVLLCDVVRNGCLLTPAAGCLVSFDNNQARLKVLIWWWKEPLAVAAGQPVKSWLGFTTEAKETKIGWALQINNTVPSLTRDDAERGCCLLPK